MAALNLDYAPESVIETADLPEAQWLEYRRGGIGGSDASAVLGVSPFTTSRDLYYDKLGIVSAGEAESNWVAKEIGHLLEDLVAKIFHIKTGYQIFQMKMIFRHPLYPFMLANVDYLIELPDGENAVLEIKTTNHRATDKWFDGEQEIVPLNYELQGRHYMAVLNLNRVYFCCLYGNNEDEVIIRRIDRDFDYEAELIALEENFWTNHVQAKIPPPYTEDGDLVLDSVNRHHGSADPSAPEMFLGGDMAENLIVYTALQQEKSELDLQVKEVDSRMKRIRGIVSDQMGRVCSAVCESGGEVWSVTNKPVLRHMIGRENLAVLRERHPEVYDEYVSVSESRRFTVRKGSAKADTAA